MHHPKQKSVITIATRLAATLAVLFIAACATPSNTPGSVPTAPRTNPAKFQVAPTGSLRVAVFTGNPLIGTRQANGDITGTTVTLGRALAAELGVPVFIIEYSSIPNVIEGGKAGAWDVTVLGVDPARKSLIDYAPAHLSVDLTYLVPAASKLNSAADIDKAGVKVAAAKGGVPAIMLERMLTKATLYETDTEATALAALKSGKAQALAQNRSMLLKVSESLPGSRVVGDRFFAAELAFALPKDRPGALTYVSDFVERAKASGLVKQAVEEAGLRAVNVAPAK